MTELSIVKKSVVFKEHWQRLLTYKLASLKDDEAIMITRKRGEPIGGILSAWHRIAKVKGFKARTKTIKHQLGYTVYLTFEKGK
jgi:hypothetical protein